MTRVGRVVLCARRVAATRKILRLWTILRGRARLRLGLLVLVVARVLGILLGEALELLPLLGCRVLLQRAGDITKLLRLLPILVGLIRDLAQHFLDAAEGRGIGSRSVARLIAAFRRLRSGLGIALR